MAPGCWVGTEGSPGGVEAAQAAGCSCVAVTNTHTRERLQRADLTVETLVEVTLDTLRGLLQGP